MGKYDLVAGRKGDFGIFEPVYGLRQNAGQESIGRDKSTLKDSTAEEPRQGVN